MARLPWTKFQDFYLRLGFLKVLTAALSPQRRSALNDQIVRRLEAPLFDNTARHSHLLSRTQERMTWYPKTVGAKTVDHPEVAEALLVDGGIGSLLYGITHDTAYKILDWARDVELIGRGNQITERGLLLRSLIPDKSSGEFFSGDVTAWNPFVLETAERLLLLFHLVEIDRLTVELIDDLAALQPGTVLESVDAAKLTCHAFFRVLDQSRDAVEPRDLPTYRTARELACTIANELGLEEYSAICAGAVSRRPPKPPKIGKRGGSLFGGANASRVRKTVKNADHQTIPRFEQLVDLGFLTKPLDGDGNHDARVLAGRRRWRYIPTAACRRWSAAKAEHRASTPFQWHGFAHAAVSALSIHSPEHQRQIDARDVAGYLWRAYERVGRPIGQTPVDSIALFATILAASEGVVIEMIEFHRLLLMVKEMNALPQHAFFAAGNELDSMFVRLKPGFLEKVQSAGLITQQSEST